MDYRLALKLYFSLFSFKKNNMRAFNFKRIIMSLFLLPIFMLTLCMNRFFLMLDHLFFPSFKKIHHFKSVFIVSAPRSATTYLFHKLANVEDKMTAFKLWESVFAPAIIQKYFFLFLLKIDTLIGKPAQRTILFLEKKMLKNFHNIHLTSLSYYEEDEVLLLWNFSTIYLHFFYPDTPIFDDYFIFDQALDAKQRKRTMKYYYQCVQRHNYVFNPKNDKYFLSKNPTLMSKVKSLHLYFPNATIININRSPRKTIPSTIALNNSIYSLFTSKKVTDEMNLRTKEILVNWYKMAEEHLQTYYAENWIKVDFKSLISNDEATITKLCQTFEIPKDTFLNERKAAKTPKVSHISKNKYADLSEAELSEVLKEIPFMVKYNS